MSINTAKDGRMSPPARPGALDAFKKPSVIAGKEVAYKAPVSGCVGVLKDNKQHHND